MSKNVTPIVKLSIAFHALIVYLVITNFLGPAEMFVIAITAKI
jgi:hypothetical protein